jgi:hypothetical protein
MASTKFIYWANREIKKEKIVENSSILRAI